MSISIQDIESRKQEDLKKIARNLKLILIAFIALNIITFGIVIAVLFL